MIASQKRRMVSILAGVLGPLVIGMAILACGSPGTEDKSDEFRGLKWGKPLNDLVQFELLAEDGNLKFYKKKSEVLKVGEVPVENVVYGLHKDRFYNVMIYFKSLENFSAIKSALTKQYGQPLEPDQKSKKCFWNLDPVNLLLDYDEGAGAGRISYFYKPIQTEIEVN